MSNITTQHVDTVEAFRYAETLYDLLVDFTNSDPDGLTVARRGLTVDGWTEVRRALVELLTASIEADKALGHDID